MPIESDFSLVGQALTLAQADGRTTAIPGQQGTTAQPGDLNAPAGAAGTTGPPPASPFGGGLLPMMLIGLMLIMIFTAFSGRRQQKRELAKRQEMLDSLTKRDRIVTRGGIVGTIVEMHKDELVLKVDESTNSRIRVTTASVDQVLKHAPGKPADHDLESEEAPEPETAAV